MAALVSAAGLLTGCTPQGGHVVQSGKDIYAVCGSCHGANAEGMPMYGAPAIAGLPKWYLESTLRKFRGGVRGTHPDDVEGLRMRPMSWQLRSDAEILAVVDYIAALPPVKAPTTLKDADAAAGATAYATCAACHGANGAGNEALKAPPIAGQNDWYLVSQLRKFKDGVRGTNPDDVTGAQMRPMAMTLPDEQAMKNVVAHISTLSR